MRAALGGPQRAAALLLGLGMLSFAAGNIAYVALIRLEVEPPVPSLADVGYLGFYPLACAGALVIMRRGRVLSGTMWLDGLLGAVGAATALAALLNPVLSALSGGVDELVVAGAYPVGDLLLIAMLAGSLAIHGPRDRGTLSWLAAGLLCFTAADVVYALRLTSESYTIGTPLDALWSIGMTVMAFALWRPTRPPAARRDSTAVLGGPLVSTATAVGVLLWATGGPVPALTIALAVVTLALAAAPHRGRLPPAPAARRRAPPGPHRRAHGARQPARPARARRARRSTRCCWSTSTASRRSTTRSATRRATRCCARSPAG